MEQLSWHPPGKWSVAEILEHLYLTYTGTSKGFSRVLESGNAIGNTPTLRQRLGALVVVQLGYFPRGVKSPRVAVPRGVGSEKSLADIGAKIAEMEEIMSRCEARFGPKTRILDHPSARPVFGVAVAEVSFGARSAPHETDPPVAEPILRSRKNRN